MARVRCEACEDLIRYNTEWPSNDWIQCGLSDYGNKYDEEKVAWFCKDCFGTMLKYSKDIGNWINYQEIKNFSQRDFLAIKIGKIRIQNNILYNK